LGVVAGHSRLGWPGRRRAFRAAIDRIGGIRALQEQRFVASDGIAERGKTR
jgi:hypothetical protein